MASFTAAALSRIRRDGRTFDVSGLRDGDRDLFVGDEVFDVEFRIGVDNDRTPRVAVRSPYLDKLIDDDLPEHTLILKNVLKLGDVLDDLCVLVEDLLTLESGQSAKLQVEDRLCLDVRKLQALHRLAKLLKKLRF